MSDSSENAKDGPESPKNPTSGEIGNGRMPDDSIIVTTDEWINDTDTENDTGNAQQSRPTTEIITEDIGVEQSKDAEGNVYNVVAGVLNIA